MALDFPNSPTNGTVYNPGAPALGSWVYDGTKWNASASIGNYVLKTGDTMTGALTLNANTVAPPAGLTPNLYVVGADGGASTLAMDCFGSGIDSRVVFRASAGTAASPTGVVGGQYIAHIDFSGRTSAGAFNAYSSRISCNATEAWSATAQGSNLVLSTTPNTTAAPVASLTLQGNIANFSGTVNSNGGAFNSLGTAANQNPAFALWDQFGSTRGSLQFFYSSGQLQLTNTSPGPNSAIYLPSDGSFGTTAATAVKPGGGPWAAPSGEIIKENVQPYTTGLDAVLELQPVSYNYTAESGLPTAQRFIGLIFEAVKLPETRTTATLPDGTSVPALDQGPLTYTLINAVKTLAQRLDALEQQAASG